MVDGTSTLTREMLEKVNAALKDKLLPAEVEERLQCARNLRIEGLLEEARAEAKSALALDSKSEPARRLVAEITREIELLEETKKREREPALERLLEAMRAAIQQDRTTDAVRLGREALGRAGEDFLVSEWMKVAEQKLGGESRGTGKLVDVEIPLFPEGDPSEELIREYVIERAAPRTGGSGSSLPEVSARAVEEARLRSASGTRVTRASVPDRAESTTKEQIGRRSGTMVLEKPARARPGSAWWKKPIAYMGLAAVAGAVVIASIAWKRPRPPVAPAPIEAAQTNAATAEVKPKDPTVAHTPEQITQAPLGEVSAKKNEEEQLFAQAQQLAQQGDSASLQQAATLLSRAIAKNGTNRGKAEQLREDVVRRLSTNEQDLQRNQQVAAIATSARRNLDVGDTSSARGKLQQIRQLGSDDTDLAAEIDRTERARFASLESEFQQDAQSADERARNHLVDLQRQFGALAAGGGPMANSARSYAENLIPAKISEIGSKLSAATSSNTDNQAFENAVRDYKRFLDARDTASLKNVSLPKFQAIAEGGSAHAADARQYVENLIPASIRQLAPYPQIGCAQVPAGLEPSIKAGELVACGLLDQPRLKWLQFTWPEFPSAARQAGQTKGVAMLILTVDENGNVTEARPRGRQDAYGFADAAITAAQAWKTNPPKAQGKGVRTQFSVDVAFGQ